MPRKLRVCQPLLMTRPGSKCPWRRAGYLFSPLFRRRCDRSAEHGKLLHTLQDVLDDQRQAQFHCVLVYMRHADDPTPLVCHGSWPGVITREPAGKRWFWLRPNLLCRPKENGC